MPYVFVTTLIRLFSTKKFSGFCRSYRNTVIHNKLQKKWELKEIGPTIVGDEWSDPELMHFLGAELIHEFGNNFKSYRAPSCPRIILNKLEERGYRVLTTTGVGQTCIWTCYKEEEQKNITKEISFAEAVKSDR